MHTRGAFRKGFDDFLLLFGWLHHHRFIVGGGRGQIQLIGGLNIGHQLEHIHQLRQIEKTGEPRSGTIARSLRRKLNGRHRFPEGAGPAIEMREAFLFQGVVLQIPLHGIKLGHAV